MTLAHAADGGGRPPGPPLREGRLLAAIEASSRGLPAHVAIGPGDDMALLQVAGGRLLVAVDQVVEGRHFLPGTPPALVGAKAVLRNLSDVAAMAGRPLACLAACVLPAGFSEADAALLFEGVRATAAGAGCPLIGGDIAVHAAAAPSAPLVVSVTILALPRDAGDAAAEAAGPGGGVVRRRAAQAGDVVFVTGVLGGSFGPDGMGRHLRPQPRVQEALVLAAALGPALHSMLDLSDGLGRDGAHLVDERHQVVLDASRLPCASGCDWRAALGDGEDYELCLAVDPRVRPPERPAGTTLTAVGRVQLRSAGEPACVVIVDGRTLDATALGWEHRGHAAP